MWNKKDDGIDPLVDNVKEYSISHAEIKSTGVTMCTEHKWRKLNEKEIACIVCPTAHIVNRADDYIA